MQSGIVRQTRIFNYVVVFYSFLTTCTLQGSAILQPVVENARAGLNRFGTAGFSGSTSSASIT